MGSAATTDTTNTNAGVGQPAAAPAASSGFDWEELLGKLCSTIVGFLKGIFTGGGSLLSALFSNNAPAAAQGLADAAHSRMGQPAPEYDNKQLASLPRPPGRAEGNTR